MITPESVLIELYNSSCGEGYLFGYSKPFIPANVCEREADQMAFVVQIDGKLCCLCVDSAKNINQFRDAITKFKKDGLVQLGGDDGNAIRLTPAGRDFAGKLNGSLLQSPPPL